jgi:hypothetical protein
MPFPSNQSALLAAGYEYARWEKCGTCQLPCEVWTTPGKREIFMDPMPSHETPSVRHYETCKGAISHQSTSPLTWSDIDKPSSIPPFKE